MMTPPARPPAPVAMPRRWRAAARVRGDEAGIRAATRAASAWAGAAMGDQLARDHGALDVEEREDGVPERDMQPDRDPSAGVDLERYVRRPTDFGPARWPTHAAVRHDQIGRQPAHAAGLSPTSRAIVLRGPDRGQGRLQDGTALASDGSRPYVGYHPAEGRVAAGSGDMPLSLLKRPFFQQLAPGRSDRASCQPPSTAYFFALIAIYYFNNVTAKIFSDTY